MPLEVDLVLVPVDGSEAAMTAVEYAVPIADRYEADLHLLYVLGETLARGIESGDVEEESVARESRTFLEDVREMAPAGLEVDSSMAYGFSTLRKTVHPGSVILDCAEDLDSDFLVIPRESTGRGGDGDVLEKAAEYVLLYASQPVLSV